MKVNNYPVKTPESGDKLFGSDSSGDQYQFDLLAVSNNGFTYEIGQYVPSEGGVIFHRYIDNGVQYYLVVDTTNLSVSSAWSNVASTLIGSTAQSTWDGLSNSNAIVGQSGFTSGAAKLCLDSTNNSKSDWYLPAISELSLLYNNMFNVNKTLNSISGTQLIVTAYWSSTELSSNEAWYYVNWQSFNQSKSFGFGYVRAVRKFSI